MWQIKFKSDITFLNMILYKMMTDFNVFGSWVPNWSFCSVYYTYMITLKMYILSVKAKVS